MMSDLKTRFRLWILHQMDSWQEGEFHLRHSRIYKFWEWAVVPMAYNGGFNITHWWRWVTRKADQ
jgi:hypothetical protein